MEVSEDATDLIEVFDDIPEHLFEEIFGMIKPEHLFSLKQMSPVVESKFKDLTFYSAYFHKILLPYIQRLLSSNDISIEEQEYFLMGLLGPDNYIKQSITNSKRWYIENIFSGVIAGNRLKLLVELLVKKEGIDFFNKILYNITYISQYIGKHDNIGMINYIIASASEKKKDKMLKWIIMGATESNRFDM